MNESLKQLIAGLRAGGLDFAAPHVWHAFAFMLPEGREAIERAGAFLRQALPQR